MMGACVRTAALLVAVWTAGPSATQTFDHDYTAYARVLARHVVPPLVDYAALQASRDALDQVVASFDLPPSHAETGWTRDQRLAFWINAYNALTLRAIVDHYPIRSRWFTRQPRNSIRQIAGVWTDLTWRAAGRPVTLDDIEHRLLRPEFQEPRIHFAINCASISCPALAAQPYRPATLDTQLEAAARGYLASPEGVRLDGNTIRVSSLFDWYGDDFIARYAPLVPGTRPLKERAILGAIIQHGAPDAADLARRGTARLVFLAYNWSLNDTAR